MLKFIKQMKNNTPSHTKINKTILLISSVLPSPNSPISFNISPSMRNLPSNFRHAKIKLISKSNRPSTDPLNNRPISSHRYHAKYMNRYSTLDYAHTYKETTVFPIPKIWIPSKSLHGLWSGNHNRDNSKCKWQ